MSRPEWLQVGAEVGTFTLGGMTRVSTSRSTIARIGKRDVVLADGQRFNASTCVRHPQTWGPSTYLTRVDDPGFLRQEAEYRKQVTSQRVEALMRQWRDGDDSARDKALRLLGGES